MENKSFQKDAQLNPLLVVKNILIEINVQSANKITIWKIINVNKIPLNQLIFVNNIILLLNVESVFRDIILLKINNVK